MRRIFFPLLLATLGLLLFGPHAARTGLHIDDHAFHAQLSKADWPQVKAAFLDYVPGRNLHILFYAGLYKVLGADPARLHLFGLALDLANAVLVFALLRRIGLPPSATLAASGLFLVYPNHAETHFWTVLIVQCLLPMTLVLGAFLAAAKRDWPPGRRLAAAFFLYALALFDYDQAFFLWIPLLYFVSRVAPGADVPRRHKILFAGACLTLNVVHVLLRLFAPRASGGRPMITWANFPQGVWTSLDASLVPLRKLPLWLSLQSWAGGPTATLVLVLLLAGAWLACVARGWPQRQEDEDGRPWPLARWAAFGLLWSFCAYLPNYFWYLSPRHHYLPSFGLTLTLTAAGSYLVRGPRRWPRVALAALAFGFFALSGAAALAEGYGWAAAHRLHQRFQQRAMALLEPRPENLFVLGAPPSLFRAPAFAHPDEALFLYAEAAGHQPVQGDLQLSAGRRGAFFHNEPDLFGPEVFRWTAYEGLNVLFYDRQGALRCASALRVEPPGSPVVELTLSGAFKPNAACSTTPVLKAPVWLWSSRASQASSRALFRASNGAALLQAQARTLPGGQALEVTLQWLAEQPLDRDFAVVLSLHERGGRAVFEPLHSQRWPRWSEPRALWPLYNDLQPPSSWRSGRAVTETYRLNLAEPLPPGALEARLTLFEAAGGGSWRRLERHSVPLSRLEPSSQNARIAR